MKEIVRKIKIFNFEELDENIKNKLIENEVNCQFEQFCTYYLYEEMERKAEELLNKYFKNKASFKNVYYNLDYSQGNGAMIEFELKYYGKLVKINQYGNYYNERSFIVDSYELTDKQEEKLKNKIININEELAKYGYDLLDWYSTKEAQKEAIETLKEYEYYKNGEIV